MVPELGEQRLDLISAFGAENRASGESALQRPQQLLKSMIQRSRATAWAVARDKQLSGARSDPQGGAHGTLRSEARTRRGLERATAGWRNLPLAH